MTLTDLLAGGAAFGRTSREPKYKIEFHPQDSPYHPVSFNQFMGCPSLVHSLCLNAILCYMFIHCAGDALLTG